MRRGVEIQRILAKHGKTYRDGGWPIRRWIYSRHGILPCISVFPALDIRCQDLNNCKCLGGHASNFSCLAHIIGGLFRTRQPSTQGQSSQHPYRKRHVGKASEGWARGNGIYWHTYMVSCFVFLPQWYGSPGTTPGLSICKLFAAFLRSSLVFTN